MAQDTAHGPFGRTLGMLTGLALLAGLQAAGYAGANPPGVRDLPAADALPVVKKLPDPFLLNDGTRVATKQDWARRREQIKAMLLYYQYGHMPAAPKHLKAVRLSSKKVFDGRATEKRLRLEVGPGGKVKFHVNLIVPAGRGPFPVIIKNDRRLGGVPVARETVGRGYIIAQYVRTDLDKDETKSVGAAQRAYPEYDWATLAVWAWGGMRLIDYLVTLDVVDKDRIAFTGHSRGGKTALLAGALDERIALTVPNGSGCGGAGCYRVETRTTQGRRKRSETLKDITTRFDYWFQPRLATFANKETRLPFDQHFLKALVAPRALISIDALGDTWANPLGTQQTYLAVKPVFDFLNAGEKNGIYFRKGGHAQNEDDWRTLVDFADKQFFGKSPTSGKRFDVLPFPDVRAPFSWKAPPRAGVKKAPR